MLDRSLGSLLRLASPQFVLAVLLSFAAGIATIGQALVLSTIVDRAFLGQEPLSNQIPFLGALAGVAILRAALQMGSEIASTRVAVQVKDYLRRSLFDHLLALGPAFTQGERTGELTTTLTEGIEALDAYFSQYLPQLIVAALVPLTIFFVILPSDLLSALVLFVTAPLIPFFMILIGNAAEGLTHRRFDLLSNLSAHFLDTLQGLATLKALNVSALQDRTIAQASTRYADATLKVLRVAFLSALVLEMVATISTAIVAVEVGLRLLYGQMQFQPALMILILAPEFYLPLRMLGLRFHSAASATSAARRIFNTLATPVSPNGGQTQEAPGAKISGGWTKISFQSVQYSYPDGREALRGVSFEIHAGEVVALVGPSGAGKSTIVNLLLRFIEPTSGQITVDGKNLADITPSGWRGGISWASQVPHLFHDSIAANLRLANPSASSKEMREAVRAAQLDSYIDLLPEKFETVTGERGARLSGGEAQRLALARAFLRNAPFVILDEQTSNVDPETEDLLRETIERLMKGRTVLIIAHRLSTVYRADRTIVLDSGRVVQVGHHSDLVKQEGLYRRLAGGFS